VNLAGKRQLWVQGGTPQAPVPSGHSFAVLRCGIDGRTGGNTQWIGYPTGARHVVLLRLLRARGHGHRHAHREAAHVAGGGLPQRVPFTSTLSQSGTFALTGRQQRDVVRPAVGRGAPDPAQLPAGWQLADVSCAASKTSVDHTSGLAEVTLVAGENVVCSYVLAPADRAAGLTVRAYAEGGSRGVRRDRHVRRAGGSAPVSLR
jgi:hypothetical protein